MYSITAALSCYFVIYCCLQYLHFNLWFCFFPSVQHCAAILFNKLCVYVCMLVSGYVSEKTELSSWTGVCLLTYCAKFLPGALKRPLAAAVLMRHAAETWLDSLRRGRCYEGLLLLLLLLLWTWSVRWHWPSSRGRRRPSSSAASSAYNPPVSRSTFNLSQHQRRSGTSWPVSRGNYCNWYRAVITSWHRSWKKKLLTRTWTKIYFKNR